MEIERKSVYGHETIPSYFRLEGEPNKAYEFKDCGLDQMIFYLRELRNRHRTQGHTDLKLEISNLIYEDSNIEVKLKYQRLETDEEFEDRKKRIERDRVSKEKRSKAAKLAAEKLEKETFERLKKKFEKK